MLLTLLSIGGGGEMALVEYLYVDEKRLDTYFEQVSSPVTYDKVPEWNAEIGLTGPKGGGKQTRFARPYTVHEKISKVTEYLEDEGLVDYERPGAGAKGASGVGEMFRLEKCRAKRVLIPPDSGQPKEVGALNVWISAVPRTPEEIRAIFERDGKSGDFDPFNSPGNLYLLEDAQHPDSSGICLTDVFLTLPAPRVILTICDDLRVQRLLLFLVSSMSTPLLGYILG
jgi:hypothetical protein